ncbi:MAG: hypothetical protein RSB91_04580 [Clostridia bacterium]
MGFLFFLALLGYALLIKVILPKIKMGSALLCAYMGLLGGAYLFVLALGLYRAAAFALMYAGLALVPLCAGYLLLVRKLRVRELLTPGLCLYALLSLFVVVLLRNATPWEHDSYSFWARAAKELYTFDRFYVNAESSMPHADYNPMLACLQYVLTRAFGWRESYLFYVPAAALILPFCALSEQLKKHALPLSLAFFALFALLYNATSITYTFAYLGTEGPLAVLFACLVLLWFTREADPPSATTLLPLYLGAFVLPAFKLYSGLLFALVLLTLPAARLLKGRGQAARRGWRKAWTPCVVMLGLTFLMQFSWSAIYHYHSALALAQEQLDIAAYLSGNAQAARAEVAFSPSMLFAGNPRNAGLADSFAENLSQALSLTKEALRTLLATTLDGFPVSFAGLMALIALAAVVLGSLLPKEQSKPLTASLVALTGCSTLYLLGIFGTFAVQPQTFTSLLRYAGVISNMLILSVLFFIARAISEGNRSALRLFAACCACVLVSVSAEYQYNVYVFRSAMEYDSAIYAKQAISEVTPDALSRVQADERLLVCDGVYSERYTSGTANCYQYYLLPNRSKILLMGGSNTALDPTLLTKESWDQLCAENRIDKLIFHFDADDERAQTLASVLQIKPKAGGVWLIDVIPQNGVITYRVSEPPFHVQGGCYEPLA